MGEVAVTVEDLSKRFRLYRERNSSLKASIMRGRRARYDELWALKDVSFEVPAGSTFGLVGHNGSGKSTLLKCLANILRPDAGRVSLTGKVSALLELGAGFHPELSGRDNVYLNASILGLSRKEVDLRFDEIVGFAGLEDFIDNPVKNYSSGMYVRLGFSVAINVDPDILLVDEVLAVGDESFQRRCNEKFADLKASGKTIVVVSHALGAVRSLCDEVAWLEKGRCLDVGPAGEVIDRYVDGVRAARPDAGPAVQGEQGSRAGSGEAQIRMIELLGPDGQPTTRVRTGDPVTIRLHWVAVQPVHAPIVGLRISTLSGTAVAGPNTRDGGAPVEVLDGSGHLDLVVPSFPLLPGTYEISTALMDQSLLHEYDGWAHALRFDVALGTPAEHSGALVPLNGRWTAPETPG